MRWTAVLVLMLVVPTACGGGGERPALSGAPTTTTIPRTGDVTGEALPDVPPGLPPIGIGAPHQDGLGVWTLDGELVATIPGVGLGSTEPGRPLSVWYESPDGFSQFVVHTEGRTYAQVRRPDDPDRFEDVPRPPGVPDVGRWRWRWVVQQPGGSVSLGQWSGECEVPWAFFIDADGMVRSVLGGDWTTEPTNTAMGWLPDGRALVDVREESGCGTVGPEPGRYAIDPVTLERERMDLPAGGVIYESVG